MVDEDGRKRVSSLSSGIQGMRFMQRKRERSIRQQLKEESDAQGSQAIDGDKEDASSAASRRSVRSLTTGGLCIVDESSFGESAIMVGRRSFKKFNAAFDADQGAKKTDSDTRTEHQKAEKDAAIPASEMAKWRSKNVSGRPEDDEVRPPKFKKPKL
mmetsp:Transcript_11411/g.34909  ORF Transcript_11411/g.34909 Transcript_11411/m.34909 type:complete len:157 (-) Transcript_11411:84-554(-)